MKTVVITGVDSSGKTSGIASLPWKQVRKYPNDEVLKSHIIGLQKYLLDGGAELHEDTIKNIFRQIHDLYDRDFRIPFEYNNQDEPVLIFDRYFIDNIVHSRMNGVEKKKYSEEHLFVPDLVIMLKCREYKTWKEKFKLKGDENIKEPAVLFHEVQKEILTVMKELKESKKIKNYTIIEGLTENTNQRLKEVISDLISS